MAVPVEKNSGFILLHRSVREHWIWEDEKKLKWWIDILMECNHEDRQVLIKFELIDCKRGQTINSLLTWSKRWHVDTSTVRRFLYLCESDAMITVENLKITTRLTVCNYDAYNSNQQTKQFQSNGKAIPKQSQDTLQSNLDAIQTNNEINKRRKDASASPTPEQEKDFTKFECWINDNAPIVGKMKEPFTIDQFLQIKKKYPVGRITDILQAMHNWQPLVKKNRSAYLTACKWLRRPGKDGTGHGETGGSAPLTTLIQPDVH